MSAVPPTPLPAPTAPPASTAATTQPQQPQQPPQPPPSPSLFQQVLTDAKAVKEEYMGPDYPYYKYVRTPSEIGMSGKGSLAQLGKDIDGLVSYVELLVSGSGKASATGKPLGNKFFLKTGGKCTAADGSAQDRFIYVNNVPTGNIPIVSSGMGVNFGEFKGLVPGTLSNLNAFNPMSMFQAFLAGSSPDCRPVTMETIDIYNNRSTETHYVTLVDLQNMDPCNFPDRTNPVTRAKCRETFQGYDQGYDQGYRDQGQGYRDQGQGGGGKERNKQSPDDRLCDGLRLLYLGSLGVLGLVLLHGTMKRLGGI